MKPTAPACDSGKSRLWLFISREVRHQRMLRAGALPDEDPIAGCGRASAATGGVMLSFGAHAHRRFAAQRPRARQRSRIVGCVG
jgi:hypothetical protein